MGIARTTQGSQSGGPLLLRGCLAGPEVDAYRSKIGGTARLGGTAKDIGPPGDGKVHETGGHNRCFKLCFQQSTGNSTGPEVDPPFGALGHWPLHQDIADLQPSVRLEHPGHFR